MNEVVKLAQQLRQLSKQSPPSAKRTNLEKIATIAIIHNHMVKQSGKEKMVEKGLSRAKKLLLGAGLGTGVIGSGLYGRKKGESEGRKSGQEEMYYSALPYVRGASRRASRAETLAKYLESKSHTKKAGAGSTAAKAIGALGAVASLPAAYYYGKSTGKRKGRLRGRTEVARSALQRISRENYRFRKAMNYIMSQRGQQGGGKKND